MAAGPGEDGTANGADGEAGRGSTPPFDSLANLRALGDIQRRGLEAANQVVGRLIDRVDRSGPLFGAEPAGGPDGSRRPQDEMSPGAMSQDVMSQYAELMSSLMTTLFGGAANGWGTAPGTAPSGPPDGAVVADQLVVEAAAPGACANGELWLHNRSGAPVADVRLHSGDLRRHDGSAIAASAVTFDPVVIGELPDLTSRGVRVAIDVPPDTQPGVYRATVMASNLPDVWLVLELTVVA